jgi:hypothetical protein
VAHSVSGWATNSEGELNVTRGFEIYDITSRKVLGWADNKGEADRKFVELEKKYPKRKLWLRIAR